MNYFSLLFTALFLFIGLALSGQFIGMNMSMFQAQGEFNQNIDNDAIGVSFTYAQALNDGPWSLGGELGIAMYSSKEYDTIDDRGQEITVFEEDCFYSLHAHGQYVLLDDHLYQVYGEGRLGFTTFFSEKHASDEEAEFDDSFRFHGTAFNMGIGGGIRINLSSMFSRDRAGNDSVWLDGAYSTNSGSRATYRNAGESTFLLSDANYRSLTDYTHLRVGIAFRLD